MSEPKHDCAFIVENDYFRFRAGGNIEGKDCHTLEFYYLLSTEEDISKIPAKTDEDEELIWIPVEKIPESNIKPNFIKNRIGEILNHTGPLHIVEDSDRNS